MTTPLITKPGLVFDMAATDYFADPCPAPSLTQSTAKTLNHWTPAHAWVEHPRLNPRWEADEPRKFDVGNVAHTLLLGRGKLIVTIDADDWRTKAAKEAREAALAEGKLAVLAKDYDKGAAMGAAAIAQLKQRGYGADWADDGGSAEVVATATITVGGQKIWLRGMIDWLSTDLRRVWDYKTTDRSAGPEGVDWRMVDGGWDVQAAMHERILDLIDPDNAGRREHRFVAQETFEPYALHVVRLPESALTMGRKQLDMAIATWARCVATNKWPGYPLDDHIASYPENRERRVLDREVAAVENPPRLGGMIPSIMGG